MPSAIADTRRNSPDVILASSSPALGPLLQATRTIPIVFTAITDPVGAGFVDSLARPGGNATGFTSFEYGNSGKWLEFLKEIAPHVTRVAVLRDAAIAAGIGQFGAIQSAAPSLGVEVSALNVRDAGEIERAFAAFARSSNGGLIVTSSALAYIHRNLIITLAARHKLPAVYNNRYFVTGGGLVSYGPDRIDQFRRAAGYVDRILKGEKPADLPVQAPTKYELVINLKTARALGLDVPPTLLARADEVIEWARLSAVQTAVWLRSEAPGPRVIGEPKFLLPVVVLPEPLLGEDVMDKLINELLLLTCMGTFVASATYAVTLLH